MEHFHFCCIAIATASQRFLLSWKALCRLWISNAAFRKNKAYQAKERANMSYSFNTQDSAYDTAWSELNENHLVVACGDGSVKMYDMAGSELAVQDWKEHSREVYAVSWNMVSKDSFVSSSWDGTIKLVCDFSVSLCGGEDYGSHAYNSGLLREHNHCSHFPRIHVLILQPFPPIRSQSYPL